jgi:superfamily II DNA or RNA helicase
MTIRDTLQEDWAIKYVNHNDSGIMHLCPRSGKVRTSIKIFERMGKFPKILIAYPDKNIEQGWESDIKAVRYKNPNVEYVTHLSLEKKLGNYDLVVIDEIHLLSPKQKGIVNKYIQKGNRILGLSGTLSKTTESELRDELGLEIISEYGLNLAIKDGLISDYRIKIVKVDLDDKELLYKKGTRTEKKQYGALTWVIRNRGQNMMLNLQRMRVIHNSIAKIKKTKDILTQLKDKRVLIFCSGNKTAQELECTIHTSKFNNQDKFDEFASGEGNHIAVCKIGNTGVSFKDLSHVVVQAFDSSSENLCQRICRSLILDAPGKVSTIYIVVSTEDVEQRWLTSALEFFDTKKIEYIKN